MLEEEKMQTIRGPLLLALLLLVIFHIATPSLSATMVNQAGCLMAPILDPDALPICSNAPGLGAPILLPAELGTAFDYLVWAEDLDGRDFGYNSQGLPGDGDYNDSVFRVQGAVGEDIFVSWYGNNTVYDNKVYFISGVPMLSPTQTSGVIPAGDLFSPGSWPDEPFELIFFLDSNLTGVNFFTGDGIRNLDGAPHFLVQDLTPPTEPVPEPGTISLFGLGLLAFAWHRRRRKETQ